MTDAKDIRFADKKVDDSWKDHMTRDQSAPAAPEKVSLKPGPSDPLPAKKTDSKTSKPFLNLVTSLAYQAMMNLGEIPNPSSQEVVEDFQAAKEIIDLLVALQTKTSDRLSAEEAELFRTLIPELQMKFSQKV